MSIKPKPKACKGNGQATGHGCGVLTLHRVYGLCKSKCYPEWLYSTDAGKVKMDKEVNSKTCKCGVDFKAYSSLDKYCSIECKKTYSKPPDLKLKTIYKPINKVSKKRAIEELKYKAQRIIFLGKPENRICFIDGCDKKADTIEHRAGRWGSNYLDESTWAGCCSFHNLELENNPELSKKYQLSKITGKPK